MNKRLVASITTALIVGAYGTVFAGTPESSFEDVPKDHWAYGAVQKLAKDGIIEGYTEQEFKGDRTLTRYELSMVVARAIDQYQKANDLDKKTIDQLSAEFASELNTLGKRLAATEKKTNTWLAADARVRYYSNSPKNGGTKLHGGDKFDFRHRLTWKGDIDEKISTQGRIIISQKFGEGANTQNKNFRIDLGYVNVKDFLGFDNMRVGRSELDSIGHGLIGKADSNDGILFQKQIKDGYYKIYTGVVDEDDAASVTNSQQLTTVEVGKKVNDNLDLSLGYYWADRDRTAKGTGRGNLNILGNSTTTSDVVFNSAQGVDVGFNLKMRKYKLFGDYVMTDIKDLNSNYNRLDSNPKGWAVQLTNSKLNAPVFYSAVNIVDRAKVGSDAWMVSYRSVDAGAIPIGGFDTMGVASPADPYNVFMHATDNVNALFLAYQKVIHKNVVMSLEYQNFKIKDKSLTDLSNSKLDQTYKMQFQFTY